MYQKPKYAGRLENVYFLKYLGGSLRQATSDVPREELPADIARLLRRLERTEANGSGSVRRGAEPDPDPAA